MTKFHINPKTDGISRCSATVKPCPFGGETGDENHYGSVREAKSALEAQFEASDGVIKTFSRTPIDPKLVEANDNLREATKVHWGLHYSLKELEEKDRSFKTTDEWYGLSQKRKRLFYAMKRAEYDRDVILGIDKTLEEQIKDSNEALDAAAAKWKTPDFDYHPDVTDKNEFEPRQAIASFSGLTENEVTERVSAHMDEGLTRTEAYRKVWDEVELRTDKPFVSIDLESAAPLDQAWVDLGRNTSLIEVGYVKRYPDGTVEEKSYLCGVPDDLREVYGTGASHVHNITPEMVEGMTPFSEDPEQMKELLDDLRGSVMIAHNARYEKSQFSYNLQGFNKMVDDGDLEILDTKNVVKHFVEGAPTWSNQSFIETTGGTYENAHRALSDAQGTLAALMRHKKID